MLISSCYSFVYSVKGLSGCAVVVHDCQDNRVGRASVQAKAVAKAETITKNDL